MSLNRPKFYFYFGAAKNFPQSGVLLSLCYLRTPGGIDEWAYDNLKGHGFNGLFPIVYKRGKRERNGRKMSRQFLREYHFLINVISCLIENGITCTIMRCGASDPRQSLNDQKVFSTFLCLTIFQISERVRCFPYSD